jgi:hypothetical protein
VKAGRRLDYLVAHQVMGFGEKFKISLKELSKSEILIPHYSSDIADAWLVVEELKQWEFELSRNRQEKWWYALFWRGEHSEIASEGPSASRAICLAALEAIGKE